MRQSPARKTRSQHISAIFDQLCDKDQQYIDDLTAQLAEIQCRYGRYSSPETRLSSGKKPESVLQHNKEQKP